MERLTLPNAINGMGGSVINCDYWKIGAVIGGHAIDMLSAYEDTGLMPEEIGSLQAELERVKAERDPCVSPC